MKTINKLFFLLAVILCLVCVFFIFAKRKEKGKVKKVYKLAANNGMSMSRHAYMLFFVASVLVAFAVRIYQFGSVPGGFNQDGAMAAVDAKALASYGTDRYGMRFPVHLTAWGYGQMSALLSYLIIPFIKLFGFYPVALRMPQLLVSIAGLICLYLFISDAFDKSMALVVLMFAAINPWHILQSRWILDCNLYPHFFVIGIYFLYKGLGKRLYLFLSMVFFGLCMYCYGVSIYTMPVFLVMACIYLLLTKKIKVMDALLCALVYLLVAGPFILVMMINFFQWDTIETPLFTLPYFPDSVRSNDILFFSENITSQLVQNFKSLMNVTLLQVKDLPWNDVENFGTMYLFSMPFALLGIVAFFKRYRNKPGAVFAFFFLLTGVLCGILTNGVNVNRINIVYYPIIIFIGIGLYEAICCFRISKWCLLTGYMLAFCMFANVYFTSYAEEIKGYFHADFGNALESVADADVDKYYITMYYNSMDMTEILLLFHHKIDAEYFQGKKDIGGLPFKDKYIISNMQYITTDPSENAAYVVSAEELAYFNTELYNIQQFGYYYTLVPK